MSSAAFGNVLGDMQTFAPNTDGLDFITVHTGRPLTQGAFAFSNYVSYARGHLLVYGDLTTQEKLYPYNDQLVEYDLDIAYGVTERFQVFFATPILLWQQPDQDMPIAVNVTTGSATYRPGFKYTLTDEADGDSAIIASYEFLTVKDSPYVGSDPKPIINLEYAKTWKSEQKKYHGLNLGYRVRSPSPAPSFSRMFPIDDQILASYAYSAPFTRTSRWIFESFVSVPVKKDPYKRLVDASSMDLLLGIKHRFIRNMNFDWGATIEPPGLESLAPQFRIFAGLVYYWKPGSTSEVAAATATPAQAANPLRVRPESSEILLGSTLPLFAEGGSPPYKFSQLVGSVRVSDTGIVRGTGIGDAEVLVTDQAGNQAKAYVLVKAIPKADKEIVLRNLQFVFDTDRLVKSSEVILDRQLPTMKAMRIKKMIILGHTDWIGTEEYNFDLSERRARAIKQILMSELGLSDDQIETIGHGEVWPLTTNETKAGRLMNRRVELKIYFQK